MATCITVIVGILLSAFVVAVLWRDHKTFTDDYLMCKYYREE